MKRALIMFLFIFYSLISYAPSTNCIYIAPGARIENPIDYSYDRLIEAVSRYESNNIDSAYNEKEGAVGRLQIRLCRIEHYNRLTGKNYTHEDMYDFKKAREVFLYFAKGKTYEQAAKNWNGSGPMTITYWEKVKSLIAT